MMWMKLCLPSNVSWHMNEKKTGETTLKIAEQQL